MLSAICCTWARSAGIHSSVASCNTCLAGKAFVGGGCVVVCAWDAAWAEEGRWHRHQRPRRACWHGPFLDERRLVSGQLERSPVVENDRLLLLDEI